MVIWVVALYSSFDLNFNTDNTLKYFQEFHALAIAYFSSDFCLCSLLLLLGYGFL